MKRYYMLSLMYPKAIKTGISYQFSVWIEESSKKLDIADAMIQASQDLNTNEVYPLMFKELKRKAYDKLKAKYQGE